MRTYTSIDELPAGLRFATILGIFDGMHRGHEQALARLVEVAAAEHAEPTVITFAPHPDLVFRGSAPSLLCDPAERMLRISAAGIANMVVQPFDREFAAQTAAEFLQRLGRGRRLAGLVMSLESSFGRGREGTIQHMRELAPAFDLRVEEVPSLCLGGERISSSRIRATLEQGRLGDVRRMLGRPYAVIGEVVHGDRRGRTLGYPTANLAFSEPVALPPNGIYATRVAWGGSDPLAPRHRRDGVASLGVRPMFGGGVRLLEAHLFDFDGDLYGKRLRVEFVRRQRGERRFASVPALIAQMGRDAERAREILASGR